MPVARALAGRAALSERTWWGGADGFCRLRRPFYVPGPGYRRAAAL